MTAALRPAAALRAVRATGADAQALYALSAPFMRSGALRERTPDAYRHPGDTFLAVRAGAGPEHPDGTGGARPGRLDACVALRALAPEADRPATGLLHNFCVRTDRQGEGLGSLLITAVVAEARRRGLRALVTATTGGGALFLRHGFQEIPASAAPREWAAGLDPARRSQVFTRPI
ncbi:GNAT family N-acetyltransferase [Kitasatospora sp. NPDC058170]|uniref:GNAT family N-acetyltransferase n=1 Tax=Kitasatospora sp. NPDC058170 TaxID=3346364 RepID=UPI0036DCAC1D